MNSYKVITVCEIYGTNVFFTQAHTPFDAAEKAEKMLSWRAKEKMIRQEVLILDGSKKTWIFESLVDKSL